MSMKKAMAKQLVLSDLSYRGQMAEAIALPKTHARRKSLEAQMAKDKATLTSWQSSHEVTSDDLSNEIAEVTELELGELSLAETAMREAMAVEWAAITAEIQTLSGESALQAGERVAAMQAEHEDRSAKHAERVSRLMSIRSEGLKWRQ